LGQLLGALVWLGLGFLLSGCVNSTVHVTIGLWRSAASETGQVSNSVGTGGTVEVPLVKERSQ
jgi:hypothetical protein